MSDILKQISYEKKELKSDYDEIDPSIRALSNSRPEQEDWESLEIKKSEIKLELEKVQNALSDKNKAGEQIDQEIEKKRESISILRTEFFNNANEIQTLKNKLLEDERARINSKNSHKNDLIEKVRKIEKEIENYNETISSDLEKLNSLEKRKNELYSDYKKLSESRFRRDGNETICPLFPGHICDSEKLNLYMESNFKKAEEKFNQNKIDESNSIKAEGKGVVSKIDNIKSEISGLKEQIESSKKQITATQTVIDSIPVYTASEITSLELEHLKQQSIELNAKKNNLEKELEIIKTANKIDDSELINKRNEIQSKLESIISRLSVRDQIDNVNKQISDYATKGKILASKITELENKEFTAKEINKAVVQDATNRVNSLFSLVNWEMYELQKNGLFAECCKAKVKGVSSSLNTGKLMNAGIDIVNAISNFKGISAPLFIDNTESVNILRNTNGQIIKLCVKPIGTKLTIKIN